MTDKHIQHLYWRAGFGINPKELKRLSGKSRQELVDALFAESLNTSQLIIDTSFFDNLTIEKYSKDEKTRQFYRKQSGLKVKEFNLAWMDRMVSSENRLQEKMTLFWANHFVCQDSVILHVQKYHNTLREHALGNFGDFVKAISREAAMIKYLNLKQNKKDKLNENFSRELMELFTLGVGEYTEDDVKEASKSFTGYDFEFQGEYKFRKNLHDDGFKFIFDKSGRYDGDMVIDMILEKKQCAQFICEKLYRYFVSDSLNQKHIEAMTAVFYPDYDIETVVRFVFMSDWFYDEQHIGTKIKSPVELLVGIQKIVPITFENPKQSIKLQRMLGQMLLYPPNVAGWEGGQSWINSNTILMRLKLASLLLNDGVISVKEQGAFSDGYEEYYRRVAKSKLTNTKLNWTNFYRDYKNLSFEEMTAILLVPALRKETGTYLNKLQKISAKDQCIQLMSLPEYQMC
ncbi:DUF1800 domain-containing protein [Bizionia psychrotolerans]|uniref:DUF1800 domain-containing protein n=1 Tax=Bizionia psychrotolerans TaxID=1492901 RepID=UPI000650844D|nr:DUF1800 domain-containing protein [Bizionia psychrotolerans]